jgi:DnaK suppressor protein
MTITLPEGYKPSKTEPFMSPLQREYFRQKLVEWRTEILRESEETIHHLQEESLQQPDSIDRATLETDQALELRRRDRQRKLISKIDEAIQRIEDNSYGYCEETGEPISLERLEARPIATLSIEAQERHERYEKNHNEDIAFNG